MLTISAFALRCGGFLNNYPDGFTNVQKNGSLIRQRTTASLLPVRAMLEK
jgi:hypothetical protein